MSANILANISPYWWSEGTELLARSGLILANMLTIISKYVYQCVPISWNMRECDVGQSVSQILTNIYACVEPTFQRRLKLANNWSINWKILESYLHLQHRPKVIYSYQSILSNYLPTTAPILANIGCITILANIGKWHLRISAHGPSRVPQR